MEPYKRDLPEIVAEILIEQHAMREEMRGMREDMRGMREDMRENSARVENQMRESSARMENLFTVMTNAVLDAMSRQNDRQQSTSSEVDDLRRRVESLENKVGR